MSKDLRVVNARYEEANPPLNALLLHLLSGKKAKFAPNKGFTGVELRFSNGEVLNGDLDAAKYFAIEGGLYGANALENVQVDQWLDFATSRLRPSDGPVAASALETTLATLNEHLRLRTYLVGHSVSIADGVAFLMLNALSAWKDILSSNKKLKFKNLIRWFTFLGLNPSFKMAVALIPKAAAEKKHGTFGELPGAKHGQVVTRFPPEPSGFLHIGHAKAAFMNDMYAKRYDGKLLLRFDDTNPRKEKDEFEDAIIADLKTMGVIPYKTSHTSDHFDLILSKCTEMIKLGHAYCDDSTPEEAKEQRDNFLPSPHRERSVEDNLALWEEMQKATEAGMKTCVRAKIDYKSKNGTMRDPVIYRVVADIPHNRTGNKFKVYPLYGFACPIVDSFEGVTHALRSNEYHDSEEQYYWFLKHIPGLRPVKIKDFGRVDFSYTVLSKRKLQWFVDEGYVSGWDDPRFPTVQGIVRRGLTMDALRQFIYDLGDSVKPVKMDILRLWAYNKKTIDRFIPRYTAVKADNVVKVELDGPEEPQWLEIALHSSNPELGNKKIMVSKSLYIEQEDAAQLTEGEEVTMMGYGNIIVGSVTKGEDGVVTRVTGKLNLAGDFKKTKMKLTWLCVDDKVREVEMIEYDTLISEKFIPKDKEFQDFVIKDSESVTKGLAESSISTLKRGDKLQFNRLGYYILDNDPVEGKPLRFVQIPDGRLKNVYLQKKIVTKGDASGQK